MGALMTKMLMTRHVKMRCWGREFNFLISLAEERREFKPLASRSYSRARNYLYTV